MRGLATQEAQRVRAIEVELSTIHLDQERQLDDLMPAITEATTLDSTAIYSVSRRDDMTELDRFHANGVPTKMELLTRRLFAASASPVFYDLARPPANQRNRVIEATSWIDKAGPGTWEASQFCREIFEPFGMQKVHQPRVLVCEGPVLLAWFGGLQADPVTVQQRRILSALIPAMQKRLSAERRLKAGARDRAVLEVVLERVGSPTFLIGPTGKIHEANAAGQTLLAQRRLEVTESLHAAIARRIGTLAFELIEVRDRGVRSHYVAIARPDANTQLIERARAAASRWGLTQRQASVLEFVTRGQATATIAAMLGVSERAIELHVTAIFDRVGVDNRAGLISRVLLS